MPNIETVLQKNILQNTDTEYYAKVAVDLPLTLSPDNSFYYSIPEEIKDEVKVGTVVNISFGKQELTGYVIDLIDSDSIKEIKNEFEIKPIFQVIYKKPIWDKKFLELASWISKYYLTNIGTVLSSSVISEVLDQHTYTLELINENYLDSGLTKEQEFIIAKLLKSKKRNLSYRTLLQKSKLSRQKFYQLINQLKNKNIVRTIIQYKQRAAAREASGRSENSHPSPQISCLKSFTLNTEQKNAFETILKSINCRSDRAISTAFLLHGITGSGKTEVYLRLIEEVLKKNKTVIYLVPEIYLVPQVYNRLLDRFDPDSVLIWHSSLSKNARISNWEKLQDGDKGDKGDKIKIILGARSAILSPIKNLGLIVIDEAHDASYKQASPAPRYDAVKVAVKRAEIENCPVLLGTATPNITDYYERQEKNNILEFPNRIENVPMPKVYLVDLKNEYPKQNKNIISNILKTNIEDALSKNEQIVLLLNRRGYASHIFCRACGYIQYCKNCSVPLVFHKSQGLMICHHCGYSLVNYNDSLPCPECKSPHFQYFGLGTQQLEEEVKKIFKNVRTIRVDSDELRKKDQHLNLWQEFASHKADILIGTQLVSKGLDLPNVTVVGVILADTMFNFPDYVSHERAFQLLTQVTGRAGRGQKPGKVFIQTYQAENPLFKFIEEHNFHKFYETEIKERKEHIYPPFTNLVRIIFQSYEEKECLNYANETLNLLADQNCQLPIINCQFLGPAPCFFTKLYGKYRYHILCKIKDENTKNNLFNNLLLRLNKNAKVEMIIDIDSVNLL